MTLIELKDGEKIATQGPFDLAKNSSIKIGGFSERAYFPTSISQMQKTLVFLEEAEIPYYVLGNMSNVLPADGRLSRQVISTKKMTGAQIGRDVFVEAGITSGSFLNLCRLSGKSGAEFLAGIPCTIGGALYMNAGVNGKYVAEIVKEVCFLRENQLIRLPVSKCEYSYKNSLFMRENAVIVGATFSLAESTSIKVKENINDYLSRRAHLPVGKSMGCVFKNPKGFSAGELIERCNLKGLRFGGAYVSEKHANFIMNDGTSTAQDVKTLIEKIRKTVYENYKILLEEEIRYLN